MERVREHLSGVDHGDAPFPLTDVQYAYWIGRQGLFDISNKPTHMYVELAGSLDPERLDAAWSAMVDLHPMLRAEFLRSGEQRVPRQPPTPYHIEIVDLRECPERDRTARIGLVRSRMSGGAPPVESWPHFEIVLHLLPGGRTILHFNIDMLVVDAVSVRLIFAGWGRLYADPTDAPAIDLTFRDYYFAEREFLARDGDRSREYWRGRARELPMAPDLPRAPAPASAAVRNPVFRHRTDELCAADWQRLRQEAEQRGLSAASVLAAAFAETLSVWSAEPRFTINTTVQRRFPLHPRVDDVIADFTSTLLLGLDWSVGGSFEERAVRCAEQLWNDLDHPHVSGVEVLRELSRAAGRTVVNPIVFTCALGDLGAAVDWAGELTHHASETAQVALDNRIQEYHGRLLVSWDTVDELYPAGLVDAMHRHYCELLRRLSRDAAAWTADGHRELPTSQRAVRSGTNATSGDVPEGLLQSPVLRAARRHPERVAVVSADRTLTYGALLDEARSLAGELRRAGAVRNAPIAVVTQVGCDRVIAPLGVLAAGAPYLPIEPDVPADRLAAMLDDADVRIAVTTSDLDASVTWPPNVRRVHIDRPRPPADQIDPPPVQQAPTDTAYIIYTSGSTGRPKGVAIDHRGPLNTVQDINERYRVGTGDKVFALSSLSFDLSVYDIFGVLGAGGTLVYPAVADLQDPAAWARAVQRHDITVWNTVPLLYSELVDAAAETGSSLASLRLVLLSGDWIPLDLPGRSRRLNPSAQLVSLGGATEASIWSVHYPIRAVDPGWRSVPYGKPLRNQRLHVLDGQLNPRPDWVEGDLYIAGTGLAQGYRGDPAATAGSFITHPGTGERLYRTGDRGRYLPDGNVELLGRTDAQVKIRGFRVELGDVESNLRRHPDVKECCAALRTLPGAEALRQVLVAYVVAEGGTAPTEETLRAYARERLPNYLVPGRIMMIDQIPRNANGKVDRAALPDPGHPGGDGQPGRVPPRTRTEHAVAEIWSEVLGRPIAELGVHDAFFNLGGNSLLLAQVQRRLSAAFANAEIQVVHLFEHQTIALMSRLVDGGRPVPVLNLDRIRQRLSSNRMARRSSHG